MAGLKSTYSAHACSGCAKTKFTALDGKDQWTAYRLTKNVYDTWMPEHFKNICSAIDQLPSNLDFDVPPLPEATGLSQDLGSLMQSNASSDSQLSNAERQSVASDTSFTVPGGGKRSLPAEARGHHWANAAVVTAPAPRNSERTTH
jgi:hypothetical protein